MPNAPLVIIERSPRVMAMSAPPRLSRIPVIFFAPRCSLNIIEENRARNTGLFAMMMEALPAVTLLSPARKRTLYAKTPVSPSITARTACLGLSLGREPSRRYMKAVRAIEAKRNRRNAPEKGPISGAMNLPATNVPPQNTAVSVSFRYIISDRSISGLFCKQLS